MTSVAVVLRRIEAIYAWCAGRIGIAFDQLLPFGAYFNYRVGVKRYQARHFEGAKRHFLAVLRSNPRHFMTNVYLGRIYVKLENYPEASRRYSAAQEVNPAAYRELDLIKEHVEALKLGANRGMLRDALESMEKCGYLLTDLGQRIQDTMRKQPRGQEGQPSQEKGGATGKGARRRTDKGQAPSARVFPVKSDFVSFKEFKKFSDMPPISDEELRDMDWDDLLKKEE